MKRAAKRLGIWLVWLVIAFIMAAIVEPIVTNYYGEFYPAIVEEKNNLYAQLDSIEENFERVYSMRNAEIDNSDEETAVVLKSERFTLRVKFDSTRTKVVSIEEQRIFAITLWGIAILVVGTVLYITYSIGKSRRYNKKIANKGNY